MAKLIKNGSSIVFTNGNIDLQENASLFHFRYTGTTNVSISYGAGVTYDTSLEIFNGVYADLLNVSDIPFTRATLQTFVGDFNTGGGGVVDIGFSNIVDLGSTSGVIDVDWSLGIKHRMTLTASSTINHSNFLQYEGQKVQELEIIISNPATVITWGSGVDPVDFTDVIYVTGLVNNVSLRLLRPDGTDGIFQSENLVR